VVRSRPPSPDEPRPGLHSTYNERENIEGIVRAVLAADPRVDVLVVDDASPDGTGALADALARESPRVHVLHRSGKAGLGKAYLAAFDWAIQRGYAYILEMDADWSHDPRYLPTLLDRASADADLVLGSRWVKGGGTRNWASAASSSAAAARCRPRHPRAGHSRPHWWSSASGRGARHRPPIRRQHRVRLPDRAHLPGHQRGFRVVEVPIVFEDRRVGQSKMSRAIVLEALAMVWKIR
jgi:dolichol-phosphate mannosyltransferase